MYWRNEKRGILRVVGLILAFSMLPFACGSGEGPDDSSISRAEFVAQAKTVCEKGNAKIGKRYGHWAERAHLHADSEGFMNNKVEKFVLPVKERQLREMRALGHPGGGGKKLEAFLAAWEEGIEIGKKDSSRLRVGDYAFQKALEMAEGVGLTICFTG